MVKAVIMIILICLFASQETFLIVIINVENSFAASYFCGNHDTFCKDYLVYRKLTEISIV